MLQEVEEYPVNIENITGMQGEISGAWFTIANMEWLHNPVNITTRVFMFLPQTPLL